MSAQVYRALAQVCRTLLKRPPTLALAVVLGITTPAWAQSSEPILGHQGIVSQSVPQDMEWVRGSRGLSIGVPKEVSARVGQPIAITVAVRNDSESAVSLYDIGTEIAFSLLDQQHRPYNVRSKFVTGWEGSSSPPFELQPGAILLEKRDLRFSADLSNPGTYYAIATRNVSVGLESGTLTSLPITVTITQ